MTKYEIIYSNGNTKITKELELSNGFAPRGKLKKVEKEFTEPQFVLTDARLKKIKRMIGLYKLYVDEKLIRCRYAAFDIKENVSWEEVDKEVVKKLL